MEEFEEGYPASQALVASIVGGLILLCFVRQDLKRKRAEKMAEQQSLSEDNPEWAYFSTLTKINLKLINWFFLFKTNKWIMTIVLILYLI